MIDPETRPSIEHPQSFRKEEYRCISTPGIETGMDSAQSAASMDWHVEVERHIKMLEEMMYASEEGFLSVGSKLMEIHAGAQEVSQKLAKLMNDYSAEEGTNSINRLRGISDRSSEQLNSFNRYSLGITMSLQNLEAPLEALPDSIHEFDRLVSHLRKMGIVAHIEAARIGSEGIDFVRLAENVSLLGEQIAAKTKEVRTYVKDVGHVIATNKIAMREMISKHSYVASNIGKDMQSNLRLLEEKQGLYRQATSAISAKSDEAVSQINLVVQSIQYHDITRQQLEHILEALRKIQTSSSLVEVVPICEVQVAQLRRVGGEFGAAVLSIIEALRNLSGALTMMLSEAEQMASFTKDSGSTFFDHVERGFQTISATMIDDHNTIKTFAASLSNISEKIREMRSFMDEMADVGLEIELLALNSRVKAAKIGKGGEALSVVAESIQHVSSDTIEQVEKVIGRMSVMVNVIDELERVEVTGDVADRAEAETFDIMGRLSAIGESFHSSNAASAEAFIETERTCAEIVQQVESLTGEITRNGELASFMISIGDTLEELKEQLRAHVPESMRASVDERLEEIRNSYTMESERVTHTAVLEGSQNDADRSSGGGDIELF